MANLMLAEFFAQFGIAVLVEASMAFVALMIYLFLIKRHSIGATVGFVVSLIVGTVVFGGAIRLLM